MTVFSKKNIVKRLIFYNVIALAPKMTGKSKKRYFGLYDWANGGSVDVFVTY